MKEDLRSKEIKSRFYPLYKGVILLVLSLITQSTLAQQFQVYQLEIIPTGLNSQVCSDYNPEAEFPDTISHIIFNLWADKGPLDLNEIPDFTIDEDFEPCNNENTNFMELDENDFPGAEWKRNFCPGEEVHLMVAAWEERVTVPVFNEGDTCLAFLPAEEIISIDDIDMEPEETTVTITEIIEIVPPEEGCGNNADGGSFKLQVDLIKSLIYAGDSLIQSTDTLLYCSTSEDLPTLRLIDVLGSLSIGIGPNTKWKRVVEGQVEADSVASGAEYQVDGPGTYIIEVPIPFACTLIDTIEVISLAPDLHPIIDGFSTICENTNTTLIIEPETLDDNLSYIWERNGQVLDNVENNIINLQDLPTGSFLFELYGELDGCQTAVDSFFLEVYCNPEITLTAPNVNLFCPGDTLSIAAVLGETPCVIPEEILYLWSTEDTTATLPLTLTEDFSYGLTVTYIYEDEVCSTSAAGETLEVLPLPRTIDGEEVFDLTIGDCESITIELADFIEDPEQFGNDLSFRFALMGQSFESGATITPNINPGEMQSYSIIPAVTTDGFTCEADTFVLNLNMLASSGFSFDEIAAALSIEVVGKAIGTCPGTKGLNLKIADEAYNPVLKYTWGISDNATGTTITEITPPVGEGGQYVIVNLPETVSGTIEVYLEVDDLCPTPREACVARSFTIANEGIDQPDIYFFAPQNTLVVLDNSAEYQWGFESKATLIPEELEGATLQSLITTTLTGHSFDPNNNYYWVLLDYGTDCLSKVYYNPPAADTLTGYADCTEIPISTSVDELSKIQDLLFNVFPNPNSGQFGIAITGSTELNERKQISITNLQGQLLVMDSFTGTQWQYNRNVLPPGIYLVQIQSNKGLMGVQKMIITQ